MLDIDKAEAELTELLNKCDRIAAETQFLIVQARQLGASFEHRFGAKHLENDLASAVEDTLEVGFRAVLREMNQRIAELEEIISHAELEELHRDHYARTL